MKRKAFFIISLLFVLLTFTITCNAWIIVDWPTIKADQSNNYQSSDFQNPPYFEQVHWDAWQIVLTEPDEVWALLGWIRDTIGNLKYIPEQRDCDDFAIIAKGAAAYQGFGNAIGLVIDYTQHHAYNAYWYLVDGEIILKKIEPQIPIFPLAFPFDHNGVIYW